MPRKRSVAARMPLSASPGGEEVGLSGLVVDCAARTGAATASITRRVRNVFIGRGPLANYHELVLRQLALAAHNRFNDYQVHAARDTLAASVAQRPDRVDGEVGADERRIAGQR